MVKMESHLLVRSAITQNTTGQMTEVGMHPHSVEAGRPSSGGDRTSFAEACALGLQMESSHHDFSLSIHVPVVCVYRFVLSKKNYYYI